jgi:hypothetical protein
MNPISQKIAGKAVSTSLERDSGGIQKTQPSKFDQVRAEQLQKSSAPVEMPPEVTQVSPAQQQILQNLLAQNSQGRPASVVKVDMENTRTTLKQLGKRVNALPKTPAYDPVRNRLMSIEQQYNNSSQALSKIGNSNNPQDYLQLQMQMYLMAENIAAVSKMMDSVVGGAKQIMQTQI